ncbi:MAG TPA: pyridoxamine 5'-phosphate oxidase family protein [Mycobacteriales bacterium]
MSDPTEPTDQADAARIPVTDRTRLRQVKHKASDDRSMLYRILDAGHVGHLAIVQDGQPYVLPVAYGRDGDRVLLHGSTGSRLFRTLATGAPTCLEVTLVDGLVLARSGFETSMHYRSVMVLGRCAVLPADQKLAAMERITEHILPGRWAQLRPPKPRELAATMLLALPLTEVSVKVSDAPPDDFAEDLDFPVWAGVVPLRTVTGIPVPAPDLRFDLPAPESAAGAPDRFDP